MDLRCCCVILSTVPCWANSRRVYTLSTCTIDDIGHKSRSEATCCRPEVVKCPTRMRRRRRRRCRSSSPSVLCRASCEYLPVVIVMSASTETTSCTSTRRHDRPWLLPRHWPARRRWLADQLADLVRHSRYHSTMTVSSTSIWVIVRRWNACNRTSVASDINVSECPSIEWPFLLTTLFCFELW